MPVSAFLSDLDAAWVRAPVELFVLGSTALMLQSTYRRATKDSDVLEVRELSLETRGELLRVAGKGSALHTRHRLYLDLVPPGLPLLPQEPRWRPVPDLPLRRLTLQMLDAVDVAVSKLKRFSANDRADIDAMVSLGLLRHEELVARVRLAFDHHFGDERLPRYLANLHAVERDAFGTEATEIELPAWMS